MIASFKLRDVQVIVFLAAMMAVARITRFLTEDRLANGYRRWVVNRYGPDSNMSYLVHCPWCTSVWVALPIMPAAVAWPNLWMLAILAIPAASMFTGLTVKG